MPTSSSDLLLYILAIFIPPIPVFMKRGCGGHLCLNLLLWILIWIPAVIHAFYIIASTPDVEHYEAVNIPSHYQNHPGPGHAQNPPPPTQNFGHNQSYSGNGPPPPPVQPVGGRAEEWDTPMQGGHQHGQGMQNPAYTGTHPQQAQPQHYGATPEPPSYHKS